MKRYLFILLISISCLTTYAYEPEIALGTRQGCTMSYMLFSPSLAQNLEIGYLGGFTSRFILQKYVGLQVELNYRQCGWNMKPTTQFVYADKAYALAPDTTLYSSYRAHYIELPFMTHIFFSKGMFRWFLNVGVNVGYLLNSKVPEGRKYDKGYKSNHFDYGIIGGTGFELNTKAGIYEIEARYNFGLADMFPNHHVNNYPRSSNQVIAVNVGILFDINKNKYKK